MDVTENDDPILNGNKLLAKIALKDELPRIKIGSYNIKCIRFPLINEFPFYIILNNNTTLYIFHLKPSFSYRFSKKKKPKFEEFPHFFSCFLLPFACLSQLQSYSRFLQQSCKAWSPNYKVGLLCIKFWRESQSQIS